MDEERSGPDRIFRIHIPTCYDAAVDSAIISQKSKTYWYILPSTAKILHKTALIIDSGDMALNNFNSSLGLKTELIEEQKKYAENGTNCAWGAAAVLIAGGLEIEPQLLPGNLGDELERVMKKLEKENTLHCGVCSDRITIKELPPDEVQSASGKSPASSLPKRRVLELVDWFQSLEK